MSPGLESGCLTKDFIPQDAICPSRAALSFSAKNEFVDRLDCEPLGWVQVRSTDGGTMGDGRQRKCCHCYPVTPRKRDRQRETGGAAVCLATEKRRLSDKGQRPRSITSSDPKSKSPQPRIRAKI